MAADVTVVHPTVCILPPALEANPLPQAALPRRETERNTVFDWNW